MPADHPRDDARLRQSNDAATPQNGGGQPGVAADGSDRLNGWKEISAYLGKGVRTAQRWERQFGMPVHRIGGEVVFALRSEIDAWSLSKSGQRQQNGTLTLPADANGEAEDMEDTPRLRLADRLRRTVLRRPHLAALAIAMAGVLLTVAAWAGVRLVRNRGNLGAAIGDVRLVGPRLEALDATGRVLWAQPFAEAQPPTRLGALLRPKVLALTDLTGDGRPEVLYIATNERNGSLLYVFNSDGRIRFQHQWTGTVRFGSRNYHGPFQALWVSVTHQADGGPVIWLSSRDLAEFPSVLERMDISGQVTGQYWSGGEVTALAAGKLTGRDVILVGAVANQHHGASLAIFDARRFGGAAPGPDDAHTCSSCPSERPERFFLFPRDDLSAAIEGETAVSSITLRSGGAFTVSVSQASMPDPVYGVAYAIIDYVFDAAFNLTRAEYNYHYRLIHDRLHELGTIDHDYAGHDQTRLLPIREWRDGTFVEVWAEDGAQGPGTSDPGAARRPVPQG